MDFEKTQYIFITGEDNEEKKEPKKKKIKMKDVFIIKKNKK